MITSILATVVFVVSYHSAYHNEIILDFVKQRQYAYAPPPKARKVDSGESKPVYHGLFEGRVESIRDREIELRVFHHEQASGLVKKYDGTEKTCLLQLTSALQSGGKPENFPGVDKAFGDKHYYRKDEIRIHDVIEITVFVQDKNLICQTLGLRRRPNGEVCPADGTRPDVIFPFHERMNIYQAYEEKGTPIPERWGGERAEKELAERLKHVKSVLATAEKIEKEKKAKELKADPKSEKK